MPVYAVCCVALAAVYAVTSLPVLSDASGARALLLVLRGFLGVTTLVSWFALLGDRPRLFQVSAIAVAFAATALADLAFLALQAAVGFALLVALPLLSLGASASSVIPTTLMFLPVMSTVSPTLTCRFSAAALDSAI